MSAFANKSNTTPPRPPPRFHVIKMISATKSYPDAKLGFTYRQDPDGGVIVTGIADGGLLSTTDLKAGQEITHVNGKPIIGLTMGEVGPVFASIETDIRLEVWTPVECTRGEVPPFLSEAAEGSPVPLSKWQRIYDAVENELAPAVKCFSDFEKVFSKHMGGYVRTQMTARRAVIERESESIHEHKTFLFVSQLSAASNTATLAAMNALCTANATLYGHGLYAKMGLAGMRGEKFMSKFMRNTPNGRIGFMVVE